MTIKVDEVAGLSAADLVHRRLTTTPASTTVGELREFFAQSTSHHVALLTDGERFVGSVASDTIPDAVPDSAAAADYVTADPTIAPTADAGAARDLAMAQPSLRLPVVADDGSLVGIVAITSSRTGFCGT